MWIIFISLKFKTHFSPFKKDKIKVVSHKRGLYFETKYSSNAVLTVSYGVPVARNTIKTNTWYQTAGEVKALYRQGYNIGKMKLDVALAKGTEKKTAIVLDLDETVVDNSPYQAMIVKEKKGFPYKWEEWIQQAKADTLPGADFFLQYAKKV